MLSVDFKKTFYFLPLPICILQDGLCRMVNPTFIRLTGYPEKELLGAPFIKLIHPEDRARAEDKMQGLLAEKCAPGCCYKYKIINQTGVACYVGCTFFAGWFDGKKALLVQMQDVTEKKAAKGALSQPEIEYRTLFETMLQGVIYHDAGGRIISANPAAEKILGLTRDRMLGRVSVYPKYKLIREDGSDFPVETHPSMTALETGKVVKNVVMGVYDSGEKKCRWINIHAMPLFYPGEDKPFQVYSTFDDITERKEAEERLKYLSLHDPLTGLYNRIYFEDGLRRLRNGKFGPVGIIVCDLDGLKFVNDTLGHDTGDALLAAAARVIGESFRKEDVVTRIGGDEFAVLLPHSNEKSVAAACKRLRDNIAGYNAANPELPLSISIGFAVRSEASKNIDDLFREADNKMYREKLHRNKSARGSIVQTLMKALEARDYITEGHADRLKDLVIKLAKAACLSDSQIADMSLLAQFHDIGKVGVSDSILFKPGALTREEYAEMQRHCEIGYRIAMTAPDLAPIADWILKHHEWWNGSGYPLGLKEEEIPLECRILAICDAYDALTNNRPYRKGKSHRKSIAEIKRCSGTQFDPNLVSKFINLF